MSKDYVRRYTLMVDLDQDVRTKAWRIRCQRRKYDLQSSVVDLQEEAIRSSVTHAMSWLLGAVGDAEKNEHLVPNLVGKD